MRALLGLLLLLPLSLMAATAQDLEGQWVVDAEATWAMMQENPQMKAQFGAMPPEQQEMIKSMVMGKMAQMTWSLKDGSAVITEADGVVRTSAWKVVKAEGDTLSVEAQDDQGVSRAGTLTLTGDRLVARGFSDPGKTQGRTDTAVVMKRGEPAPAPAPVE